jgi:hypothetical protein
MAKQKYRRPNIRWARPEERLPKNHGWQCKPGYKIFVANRGEVRFDFPESWIVSFGDDSVRLNDREPPDDECVLQISVHYLPPGIDWSGLPLRTLLESIGDENDKERQTLGRGEMFEVKRPDLELAWYEQRVLDVKENREAISRICLARAQNIQPLITFYFWPEDLNRLDPVWNEVLRSLQVGNVIPDPTKYYLH